MLPLTKLFLALALVMSVGGLTAGIITFDNATDVGGTGDPYPSASDSGVTVSFYVGANSLTCPANCNIGVELTPAFGAVPGGTTTAFDMLDSREAGFTDSPFLTDEEDGPIAELDYFMVFSGVSIFDLSMQLLDYRVDGGPSLSDFATLAVFSSSDWNPANLIDTDFFQIPPGGPNPLDGDVRELSIPGGATPILSARVTFSTPDIGTGIDNVEWTSVPEPGTVVLFGSGLLALAAFARKRRART